MSTIGTFAKNGDGYNGTIQTLTFNVKVKLTPVPKETESAPDYRLDAGPIEIGAAWKRQTTGNKPYISVKLDDPSFASPVNARLVDNDNGTAVLYWTRRSTD